jgi:ketosteroid isomerase-like protein
MRRVADETVSEIMAKWAAGFSELDARALASLYSGSAFFFGSNPSLYRGNAGVETYFNALPRWNSPTVQFTDVATAQVGSDLINVAAQATFDVGEDVSPLSVKLTWVVVREGGEWKIASHHVSSLVPLI